MIPSTKTVQTERVGTENIQIPFFWQEMWPVLSEFETHWVFSYIRVVLEYKFARSPEFNTEDHVMLSNFTHLECRTGTLCGIMRFSRLIIGQRLLFQDKSNLIMFDCRSVDCVDYQKAARYSCCLTQIRESRKAPLSWIQMPEWCPCSNSVQSGSPTTLGDCGISSVHSVVEKKTLSLLNHKERLWLAKSGLSISVLGLGRFFLHWNVISCFLLSG